MGRKAEHNLTMVAAVRDEASKPLDGVVTSIDKAAAAQAAADNKLASSAAGAAKAASSRLSATKQVEFAMRAQAAAGNELQTELVVLERTYEILSVEMRKIARTGGEIPEQLRRQASAARESAAAIREKLNPAVSDFDRGFEKFKAAGIAATLFAATAQTLGVSFGMLKEQLVKTLPEAEKFEGVMSGTEKSMASLRDTISDPAWSTLPMVAKLATAAYSLFNTEISEAEQKSAQWKRETAERQRQQEAVNQVIAEEGDASAISIETSMENMKKLRQAEEADERRRQEAREKRIAEAQEQAERIVRLEQQKAKIIDDLDKRVASGKAAIGEANLQRVVELTNAEIVAREKLQKEFDDEQKKRAEEYAATMQSVASTVSGAMFTAFGSMIDGSKSAEQAFGDMFKSLGQQALRAATDAVIAEGIKKAAAVSTANTKIATDTSTAASGAMSAHAGIPFVGLALGLAAAAAIIAAIMSFKKFNRGGLITEGREGVDTVPALLSKGEMVLDAETTRRVLRVAGKSSSAPVQRFADGGVVSGSTIPIPNSTVVNANVSTLVPTSRGGVRRMLRDALVPELKELIANGQL